VALCANDVEPAGVRHTGAELDVGAAAGHVGRDRDGARLTGVSTMVASRSCCFAFRTLCGMPRTVSCWLSRSEVSTEVVPTRTGRPASRMAAISSATALNLPVSFLKMRSEASWRIMSRLVGTITTSRL
jgi:hypothetical protein